MGLDGKFTILRSISKFYVRRADNTRSDIYKLRAAVMGDKTSSDENNAFFDDTTEVGIDLPAYTGAHPFNDLEDFDTEKLQPRDEYTSYLPKVGLPEDPLEQTQQEQPVRPASSAASEPNDTSYAERFTELKEEIRDFEANLKSQQKALITFALGSEKISFHPLRVTLRKSGALDFEGRNRHGQMQTYFTQISTLTFCLSAVDASKSNSNVEAIEFVVR